MEQLKKIFVGSVWIYVALVVASGLFLMMYTRWTQARFEDDLHRHERFPIAFDAERWKKARPTPRHMDDLFDGVRQKMLLDFFKKHNPIGMTAQQLEELLGPFDVKPNLSDSEFYEIGMVGDNDRMYLEFFMKEGKVSSYKIYRFQLQRQQLETSEQSN